MTISHQQNDFYSALICLEKFETGNTNGNSYFHAPTIFALHRIVALFDSAVEKGDVIAPFFLHYLHQKYPEQIDAYYLPTLETLPTHRSQAREWVKAYKQYIDLHNQLKSLPDDLIILAKSERDGRKKEKNLKTKHKKVKSEIIQLDKFDTPIAKMLMAKSQQKYNDLACVRTQMTPAEQRVLNEAVEIIYREAAEVPNYWAMLEYVDFMEKNDRTPINLERHNKIVEELKIIQTSNGSFYPLFSKYENEHNQRAEGQWLIHSVLHGEERAMVRFYRMYCEPTQVWKNPISFPEALAQARLWANVIYQTENFSTYAELWTHLKYQISHYLETPNHYRNRKKYVSHLVMMTYQVIEKASMVVTEDSREIYQQKGALLEDFCQQYDGNFPSFVHQNQHISTEIALIYEKEKKYDVAQDLFQHAYQVAPNDPISQFNLANVLFSQSQNHNLKKQIELFTKAASSGCSDSATRLVFLTVFKNLDFDVDLEFIYELLEKNLESTVNSVVANKSIPLPKAFILSMMKIKIEDIATQTVEVVLDDIVTSIEEQHALELAVQRTESMSPSISCIETLQSPYATAHFFKPITTAKEDKRPSPKNHSPSEKHDTQIKQEDKKTSTLTDKMLKALTTLEEIASKPIRSLSFKDLERAQKAIHILNGGSENDFRVSNRGKTSGSRVSFGTKTYHLPHGKDRMIIGAQADLKSDISETLDAFSC